MDLSFFHKSMHRIDQLDWSRTEYLRASSVNEIDWESFSTMLGAVHIL
jgi:hypothetical protein